MRLLILLQLFFFLLLTACPYESEKAVIKIDEGDKLDRSLRGKWTAFYEDGTSDEITIRKAERNVFIVNHKFFNEKGRFKKSRGKFRIYGKEFDDLFLINAEKKGGGHYIGKYEFVDKEAFDLYLLKEEYVKKHYEAPVKPDAEHFLRFIRDNASNEEMWELAGEFISNESDAYKMHHYNRGF